MWTSRRARKPAAAEPASNELALAAPKPGSHFLKVADVATQPFLVELDSAAEMWKMDTSRQRKVRCQRYTENILLRAAKKPLPAGAKNANDVHESRVLPMAAKFPRTLGLCESVARSVGGHLGRATLVALRPESEVYPHIDTGAYYRIRDRYHLVLRSREGSLITAEDESVVMHEGELWSFNNKVRHSARNPSRERRIHLIFDVLPEPGQGHFVLPLQHALGNRHGAVKSTRRP